MASIEFEKLGSIKQGTLDINNLMIFCGGNNEGKTYASYVLHSLFNKRFRSNFNYFELSDLLSEGKVTIDLAQVMEKYDSILLLESERLTEELPETFSTPIRIFQDSQIRLHMDAKKVQDRFLRRSFTSNFKLPDLGDLSMKKNKDSSEVEIYVVAVADSKNKSIGESFAEFFVNRFLDQLVFEEWTSSVFLLPAERAGLNLFFKELNAARNELIHNLGTQKMNRSEDSIDFDFSNNISIYAGPISSYLTFLNSLSIYSKTESEFADLAQSIQTQILKGSYDIQDQNIQYTSLLVESENETDAVPAIGLHASSSTVKTLFGLVFYLTYMAHSGSTLIIDEPELNLHPDNQRKLARVLAQAVNRGLRVILSTHSDYIVKEFNNLIMLANEFENKNAVMEKFAYQPTQILDPKKVSAYMFGDQTITPIEITPSEGMIADTFNQVINQYNDANDEIYYSIVQDGQDEESN